MGAGAGGGVLNVCLMKVERNWMYWSAAHLFWMRAPALEGKKLGEWEKGGIGEMEIAAARIVSLSHARPPRVYVTEV